MKSLRPTDANLVAVLAKVKVWLTVKVSAILAMSVADLARRRKAKGRRQKAGRERAVSGGP
jgi:hypothetical protein